MEKIAIIVKFNNGNVAGKKLGSIDKCIDYIFNSFLYSGSNIEELKVVSASPNEQILIQKVMKLFEIREMTTIENHEDKRFAHVLMSRHGLCRDLVRTQKRMRLVDGVAI